MGGADRGTSTSSLEALVENILSDIAESARNDALVSTVKLEEILPKMRPGQFMQPFLLQPTELHRALRWRRVACSSSMPITSPSVSKPPGRMGRPICYCRRWNGLKN